MKNIATTPNEMIRLSKSKALVDLSPNTLRSYADPKLYGNKRLKIYKVGKAAFVSRNEIVEFIKSQAE